MNENENPAENAPAMAEAYAEANGGQFQPEDWHAREQRNIAQENVQALKELPMNNETTDDVIAELDQADILANRENGTAERLFNLQDSQDEVYAICAKAEESAQKKPSEDGIKGIEKLMKQSLQALNVRSVCQNEIKSNKNLKHGPTQRKLKKAMEVVLDCTRQQQETAEKVLENLMNQTTEAVQMEKQNRIIQVSKNFGISTKDLPTLKAKLTPVLPSIWKDLGIRADELEIKMEPARRLRLMAAAEVVSNSRDILRRTPFSEDKNSSYDSNNFKSPYGRFAK